MSVERTFEGSVQRVGLFGVDDAHSGVTCALKLLYQSPVIFKVHGKWRSYLALTATGDRVTLVLKASKPGGDWVLEHASNSELGPVVQFEAQQVRA